MKKHENLFKKLCKIFLCLVKTFSRIRIQLNPYIIGSLGSGSVYCLYRIYESATLHLKTACRICLDTSLQTFTDSILSMLGHKTIIYKLHVLFAWKHGKHLNTEYCLCLDTWQTFVDCMPSLLRHVANIYRLHVIFAWTRGKLVDCISSLL